MGGISVGKVGINSPLIKNWMINPMTTSLPRATAPATMRIWAYSSSILHIKTTKNIFPLQELAVNSQDIAVNNLIYIMDICLWLLSVMTKKQ